ncbi:hypothetical protein Patl1_02307 [Pistacia atlantica]|uniref:Uncharacterized protein n=1 Tax=Pistacia atlantica TaxID=434234 RepID=A0ACC1CDR4_9ROSI|nr:hypothetical protein Patl1_02307 [Pistacia atlantica]
MSKSNTLFGRA